MIRMIDLSGKLCPVIECDRCGELITNMRMGAVVFVNGFDVAPIYSGPIEFRHKRTCFPMSEREPWRELSEFLAQLVNNAWSDPREDPPDGPGGLPFPDGRIPHSVMRP